VSLRAAFVMVNHNGGNETLLSVKSLLDEMSPEDKLFLIDNGSSDNSGVRAANLSEEIHFISHDENKPFAEATNIGIRTALEEGYPFVGPINPDVRVRPGMISHLAAFLQHDRHATCAAVSPVILYDDPEDRIWFGGGRLIYPISWTQHIDRRVRLGEIRKSSRDVQFVTGCCWLSPAWAWRAVGLLDPSYGMYSEDVDWSTRAWRIEKRLVLVPDSELVHHISMSTGGGRSAIKMTYRTLAGRLFFERWTPPCLRFPQRVLTPLFVAFYATFLYLAEGPDVAKSYLRAWRTKLKDPVPWPPSRHLTGNL
jgi:GT2 family glycosyltransferase